MDKKLYNNLDKNIREMKAVFTDAQDLVFREFYGGENRFFIVYIDNMVNGETIEDAILTNVMERGKTQEDTLFLQLNTIAVGEVKQIDTFTMAYDAILLGDTVILGENSGVATQISTKGWPSRGVPQVQNEVTIQGPKDAFVEQVSRNIVLVRRRIRDTGLKVKRMKIGKRSKTDIALLYIEDVVRKEILTDLVKKMENIDIDAILDTGYIQQLIEKRTMSPFPQMQMTERPDKTAAAIFEGRVAVLVDNTPFALLLPSTLNTFFQAADDYYERWEIMSVIRFLRFFAAGLAMFLPGLYIALTVFHPNFIPTALALKIAIGRSNVPFPTIVEVMLMETAFELLREAGIRLPTPVGGTIGIVGGIIIGQAAVEAGIVGPAVVIIAALTGVCGFAVPSVTFVSGIRLVKYFLIIICSIFGLFGFWVGVVLVLVHLCSLESFGVPYMFPFCSGSVNGYTDFKDSLIRAPLEKMKKRPIFASKNEEIRQKKKGGNKGGQGK